MSYALRQKPPRLLVPADPLSESRFLRGKHQGETLEEVSRYDMQYLKFLAGDRPNGNLYVRYDVQEFLTNLANRTKTTAMVFCKECNAPTPHTFDGCNVCKQYGGEDDGASYANQQYSKGTEEGEK